MSVSTTVSNQWFTPSKSGSKGRSYRSRRSLEHQARLDVAKTEHVAATHAVDQGEWVVKGKRHNKMAAKKQTPQEKAEAARIQTMNDLKAIEKTLSGSMSAIRPLKRARDAVSLRKADDCKSKKPKIVLEKTVINKKFNQMNSFSLLAVESTDDEVDDEVDTFEIKQEEFPTLGVKSVSFAPQVQVAWGPNKATGPISRSMTYIEKSEDEEEDFTPFKTGQSWGDFV